jgi:hypothetical protein
LGIPGAIKRLIITFVFNQYGIILDFFANYKFQYISPHPWVPVPYVRLKAPEVAPGKIITEWP